MLGLLVYCLPFISLLRHLVFPAFPPFLTNRSSAHAPGSWTTLSLGLVFECSGYLLLGFFNFCECSLKSLPINTRETGPLKTGRLRLLPLSRDGKHKEASIKRTTSFRPILKKRAEKNTLGNRNIIAENQWEFIRKIVDFMLTCLVPAVFPLDDY